MNYLLDTCLISEIIKNQPQQSVVDWVDSCDEQSMFISVLTLGELQKGITKLPESHRKQLLQSWVDSDLRQRFKGRILVVDENVADIWGRIQGNAESNGKRMPVMDSLIAATALAHGLAVVTRNTPDIQLSGVSTVDPWA